MPKNDAFNKLNLSASGKNTITFTLTFTFTFTFHARATDRATSSFSQPG
jgi:hypothetical protein